MLREFEEKYIECHFRHKRLQWLNYFENGQYDLSNIDQEQFNLVKTFSDFIKPNNRKATIVKFIIDKDLVDKHPMVSHLRNKIDNFENYDALIKEEIKNDKLQYKLALSHLLKDDVKQLMSKRNELAKELGYSSYPDLIFQTQEVEQRKIIDTLNRYLVENLPKAKAIINKYNIQWENWFTDLDRIGQTKHSYQLIELIEELFKTLGYDQVYRNVKIIFLDNGFGYASELNTSDIRIVVPPIQSLSHLSTLFHEIGHALYYALNREKGIYKLITPLEDEAMAVVMEGIAPRILDIDQQDQEKMNEIKTLEYTRCAISALYEFHLWENSDRAEELYIQHYSKLGLEIKHPSLWALDSFRSIDPVYICNYVVGASIASVLFNYLNTQYGKNYFMWGEFMFNSIYKDGRKRTFKDKIDDFSNTL